MILRTTSSRHTFDFSEFGNPGQSLELFRGEIVTLLLIGVGKEKLNHHWVKIFGQKSLEKNDCLLTPVQLNKESGICKHALFVLNIERKAISHVLLCLLEVVLAKIEAV